MQNGAVLRAKHCGGEYLHFVVCFVGNSRSIILHHRQCVSLFGSSEFIVTQL